MTATDVTPAPDGDAADGGRPFVTVLVPAYNEAFVMVASLTTLHNHLHGLRDRYEFELLIVNDGSSDETGAIADAFAASRPDVRVIHHEVNLNLGGALQTGFAAARGAYVVVMDCDLSYSPDHVERLLDALREHHADMAIASPYMKGGSTSGIPLLRRMLSRGANRLLSGVTQDHISTTTGMVRAYRQEFVRSLNLKAMGPEVNTEILYKAQVLRARMIEIPAHLDWSGQEERSRLRRPRLRIRKSTMLQLFSSFLFRPMVFFVVPGLVLLAWAGWTVGWILLETLRNLDQFHGSIDDRFTRSLASVWDESPHSFIVGGTCLVIAVQLISLGLLAIQAKRYFDEVFHLGTNLLRRLQSLQDRAHNE